jgi:hypothetical protein
MESIYEANEFAVVLAIFALMVIASETGFRLGRKSGKQVIRDAKSQHLTVEAGILGVLGLMLGFTMAMALDRFELRRQLVLQEAQAIGSAHLLTQLLPAQESKEIDDLLRAYAGVRIRPEDRHDVYEQIAATRQESARLQAAFWTRAAAYGQKDPSPVRAGMLLQSLKEVIQLDAARWSAFQDRVPAAVICVIAVVGLLAVMVVGYTFGLSGVRQPFSICMLALAITMVLGIIVDLERPREGLIRVSQQPLLDLREQLGSL